MHEGTVKFYNPEKGWGFISPDNGAKDIFVHQTGLKTGLAIAEGDKVSYEITDGDKGPKAVNVEKI